MLRLRRGLFFLFLSRTRRGSASERKNKCHQTPPCVRPPVVSISNSVLAVKQAVSWTSTTGIPQKLQARRIGGTCGEHYSPDTVRELHKAELKILCSSGSHPFFFFANSLRIERTVSKICKHLIQLVILVFPQLLLEA